MPPWPRDIELEIAAAEHGDPPPHAAPPEVRMNCTKCGWQLRTDNKRGICAVETACRRRVEAVGADDQVLERVEASSTKAKTPPTTPEPEPAPPDWQRQFFQLAEALGLNPVEMLEEHCRDWVETTRRRALTTGPMGPLQLESVNE